MNRAVGALALLLLCAPQAPSQSLFVDEARVGSERELYLRVLRLVSGGGGPPTALAGRGATLAPQAFADHPWSAGVESAHRVRLLRPHGAATFNSAFAWETSHTSGWDGRGSNLHASFGAAANLWRFTLRLEPVATYSANTPFSVGSDSVFLDPMRPRSIDLPYRFGDAPVRRTDFGESHLRLDLPVLSVGIANERIFWGPGVRHALLFSTQGPGFPHVFIETNRAINTPLGSFASRLLYARLEQSDYAPGAPTSSRFGTGFLAAWTPNTVPVTLGVARFYHLPWPESFEVSDLSAPFGSLFFDAQTFSGGVADNQLATVFFSLDLSRAAMEIFGEFGRNDRSGDLRDLTVEPEHNSAWLVGLLKAFAVDSSKRSFWSARLEAASGRISAIQSIGRGQTTFYEHSPITQGHTHRGRLLGTPLIDRSGGTELAVDRWNVRGRMGFELFQRQMPADIGVGMPAQAARTQWDLAFTGLRFFPAGELSYGIGVVTDLNRLPGEDAANLHLSLGWRANISRSILPGR